MEKNNTVHDYNEFRNKLFAKIIREELEFRVGVLKKCKELEKAKNSIPQDKPVETTEE